MRKFLRNLIQLLNNPEPRRERQILVLILAIFLSITLWVLVTLNQTYELTLRYAIAIKDVPEELFLAQKNTKRIQIDTRGPGVDLIVEAIRARRDTIFLPYSDLLKGNSKISLNTYKGEIITNFQGNTLEIIRMKPDYLDLILEEKVFKKVPLRLTTDFNLLSGYQLKNDPNPEPDSVSIYGAPDRLKSIEVWETLSVSTEKIYQPTLLTVPVDTQKGLEVSPPKVKVRLQPQQYTETKLPLKVEVANVPPNTHVRLSDDTLYVSCLMPLEDYEKVRELNVKKKIRLEYRDLDPDFPHVIPDLKLSGSVIELYRDPLILSYVIVQEK